MPRPSRQYACIALCHFKAVCVHVYVAPMPLALEYLVYLLASWELLVNSRCYTTLTRLKWAETVVCSTVEPFLKDPPLK